MADLSKQREDFKNAFVAFIETIQAGGGAGGDIEAPRYELIAMVKLRLNRMMPEGEGVQFVVEDTTNTTNTLDLYINGILDESAKHVHQTAPLHIIVGKHCANTPQSSMDGSGYVELPSDFLRLQAFKMSLWNKEVNKAITTFDPVYANQKNLFTRGGKAKPVVALNTKNISGTVKRILEYYSLDPSEGHTIDKFLYVPNPAAEDVQSDLKNALAWTCAGKIAEIMGRGEEASFFYDHVKSCYENQ